MICQNACPGMDGSKDGVVGEDVFMVSVSPDNIIQGGRHGRSLISDHAGGIQVGLGAVTRDTIS